jgi:Tfp pilus assembly protein PilF
MQPEELSMNERIARWRQRVWSAIQEARQDPAFRAAAAQATPQPSQLAMRGWQALQQQQHELAQRYFRAALQHDPFSISAWYGLSQTLEAPDERRACVQAALDMAYLVYETDRSGQTRAA